MQKSLSRAPFGKISQSLYSARFQLNGFLREGTRIAPKCSISEGYSLFGFVQRMDTRAMQLQIVNSLRMGERCRASNLLLDHAQTNDSLRANDFVYILDYCARSPDPLFVLETLRIMQEKVVDIDRRCYMSIIQGLCKGGYLEEAFNWLASLRGGNHMTVPNLTMYNIFLSGCVHVKSSDYHKYVKDCLKLMEGQLIGKSEITYWELLKLAVSQQDLSMVHDIWKECLSYYNPSFISLRKFIWSFSRLRDLETAYDVLQQMVGLMIQQSSFLKISKEGRYQSSRLDIPIPSRSMTQSKRYALEENGCSSQSPPFDILATSESSCNYQNMSQTENPLNLVNVYANGQHIDKEVDLSLSSIPQNMMPSFNQMNGENGFKVLSHFATNPPLMNQSPSLKYHYGFDTDVHCTSTKESGLGTSKQNDVLPVKNILRWSFSDVMHACAHSGNYNLAEKLFLQMHELGLEPSQHTYDGFVRAVVAGRGVSHGMRVVKAMEKKHMKPYTSTLVTLSMGYSREFDLNLAEAMLDEATEISPKLTHPFNALLSACDVMDEPERAVRVLARMKDLKVMFDIRTYELLFSLFGTVNAPYEKGNILSKLDAAKRINAIESDMAKTRIQHNWASMGMLLKAIGAEGLIRELLQYLEVAENQFFHSNIYIGTSMYNTSLHALVEAKETHFAVEVFKKMRLRCLPADAATYNIMIDYCGIIKCFRSASALFSLMLKDGFYPEVCTYTALIKILLANENFEEALNLMDQAISQGVQPDVVLFNTILQEAYFKGRIDVLELIIELMRQQKVQPDSSTCSSVFSAYVDQGYFSVAMEALQVLSLRMISEETIPQEKIEEYENLIFNENPNVEMQLSSIFKSDENLASSLLNLRWCAISGFSISWSPNSSPWTRRLSLLSKETRSFKTF